MHLAYTQHRSVPESFIFTMYESYYGKASTFLNEIKLETPNCVFGSSNIWILYENDTGIH